jgi:transcription termination factor Rho
MDYKEMTLMQLKAVAKEKGLKGVSSLKKSELLELLLTREKEEHKAETASEEKRSQINWTPMG